MSISFFNIEFDKKNNERVFKIETNIELYRENINVIVAFHDQFENFEKRNVFFNYQIKIQYLYFDNINNANFHVNRFDY